MFWNTSSWAPQRSRLAQPVSLIRTRAFRSFPTYNSSVPKRRYVISMSYVAHSSQKAVEPMRPDKLKLALDLAAHAHAQKALHLVARPLLASRCVADRPRRAGATDRPSMYANQTSQSLGGRRLLVCGRVRRQENR